MFKYLYILIFSVICYKAEAQQQAPITDYLLLSKKYAATQPDSAVHYCNEAMKLAEKINDRHSQGVLLIELGRINTLHHHDELARRFINEALAVFRNLKEGEGIAVAYDELGLLDGQEQNIGAATQDMSSAAQFYRDSHDSSGIMETYKGLGKVYGEKGETEKALTWYLRSLVQYEHRQQKPEAYFLLLEEIGQLYLKKGDSKKALKYFQEGLHNSAGAAERDTEINLLAEEGQAYEQEGQSARALTVYKHALEEAKKYNRPEEQAKALISIAGVLKNNNAARSLDDLKKALKIADGLHNAQLEAAIYAALAGVYRQQKDYKEAMEALEENHRLLDSLLGADTTKEIAAIDSSYALESSREMIGSLQQVNKAAKAELDLGLIALIAVVVALVLLWFYLRKIRRLNQELKKANRVKDTLFSIIGHDLKGPAGSAAQLFALMEAEEFTEAELKSMISELRKQTESSFELLQSLFEWGRAQLQGITVHSEQVGIKSVIQKNINLLARQADAKAIIVTDYTTAGLEIIADTHHLDFIIRNLLANAIKFTYERGHIEFNAAEDDQDVILSVKDTGKGISAKQQADFHKANLQVTFGTKGEKGSGLGLMLIKDFVEANHGKIWVESKEGEGTAFYFSFPKAA